VQQRLAQQTSDHREAFEVPDMSAVSMPRQAGRLQDSSANLHQRVLFTSETTA
jgi:hypothetical protein